MKTKTLKTAILMFAFVSIITSVWAQRSNKGTSIIHNYVQTVWVTHDSVKITGQMPNQFVASGEVQIDVQYLVKRIVPHEDPKLINWRSQNGREFYIVFYSLGAMPNITYVNNGIVIDVGNGWKKIKVIPLENFSVTYQVSSGDKFGINGFTNHYGVLLLKPH